MHSLTGMLWASIVFAVRFRRLTVMVMWASARDITCTKARPATLALDLPPTPGRV